MRAHYVTIPVLGLAVGAALALSFGGAEPAPFGGLDLRDEGAAVQAAPSPIAADGATEGSAAARLLGRQGRSETAKLERAVPVDVRIAAVLTDLRRACARGNAAAAEAALDALLQAAEDASFRERLVASIEKELWRGDPLDAVHERSLLRLLARLGDKRATSILVELARGAGEGSRSREAESALGRVKNSASEELLLATFEKAGSTGMRRAIAQALCSMDSKNAVAELLHHVRDSGAEEVREVLRAGLGPTAQLRLIDHVAHLPPDPTAGNATLAPDTEIAHEILRSGVSKETIRDIVSRLRALAAQAESLTNEHPLVQALGACKGPAVRPTLEGLVLGEVDAAVRVVLIEDLAQRSIEKARPTFALLLATEKDPDVAARLRKYLAARPKTTRQDDDEIEKGR